MGWRIPSLFKSSNFLSHQLSHLTTVPHIHLTMAYLREISCSLKTTIGFTLGLSSRGPWFRSQRGRKFFPLSFLSCDLMIAVYLSKGAQSRHVFYWHAGQSCANYLRKFGLVCVGADSMMMRSIQ